MHKYICLLLLLCGCETRYVSDPKTERDANKSECTTPCRTIFYPCDHDGKINRVCTEDVLLGTWGFHQRDCAWHKVDPTGKTIGPTILLNEPKKD